MSADCSTRGRRLLARINPEAVGIEIEIGISFILTTRRRAAAILSPQSPAEYNEFTIKEGQMSILIGLYYTPVWVCRMIIKIFADCLNFVRRLPTKMGSAFVQASVVHIESTEAKTMGLRCSIQLQLKIKRSLTQSYRDKYNNAIKLKKNLLFAYEHYTDRIFNYFDGYIHSTYAQFCCFGAIFKRKSP